MTTQTNTDQAGQTTSVTNNFTVDFSHRLADSDSDSISLVNNIGLMTERANGVLQLLFWSFQQSDTGRSSDATVCAAIDSVMQEIEDIHATVNAYCEADIAKGEVQA